MGRQATQLSCFLLRISISLTNRKHPEAVMKQRSHKTYGTHYKVLKFSFPKRPDRLWGPFSLLFNGYWISLLGLQRPAVKLSTHLHLVPSLRMSGAILLLPYMPSWRGEGHFTFISQLRLFLVRCADVIVLALLTKSDIEKKIVCRLFVYSVSLAP